MSTISTETAALFRRFLRRGPFTRRLGAAGEQGQTQEQGQAGFHRASRIRNRLASSTRELALLLDASPIGAVLGDFDFLAREQGVGLGVAHVHRRRLTLGLDRSSSSAPV